MRNKKLLKALALVGAAILLVVGSVLGTLAWLTDTEVVTNTITVGNVSIELDETGAAAYGPDDSLYGKTYKLVPGGSYQKDPTVTVLQGSEESYVRVKVTVTKYSEWVAANGGTFTLTDAVDAIGTGWTLFKVEGEDGVEDNVADTYTYEYRYTGTVDASTEAKKLAPVFKNLVVPNDWSSDAIADLADAQIIIEAHAIQANGLNNADAAWTAFDNPAQQS